MSLKLGVFGGTFNPPHKGHEQMASAFLEAVSPDRMLLIPNHLPPHKAADNLASDRDRLEMLRLAFSGEERMEIDQRELKRRGKSYSYDTVCSLKDAFPEAEIFFLMGGDSFLQLESWYRFEDLLQMVTPVAFERAGEERLAEAAKKYALLYGVQAILLPEPICAVSSTEIRARLRDGLPCGDLLSPAVCAYVQEKKLYRDVQNEAEEEAVYGISVAEAGRLAQSVLSEKRCHHSLCVGKAAKALAHQEGFDEKAAEIAGRLHDLYRETDRETLLQKAAEYAIVTDDFREAANPLLHGRAGAKLLAAEHGIRSDICNAVSHHTEGCAEMDLLSKILFVADCISADRTYPDVELTRSLAKRNLNSAVAYIFSFMEQNLGDRMTEDTRRGAAHYRVYLPAELTDK